MITLKRFFIKFLENTFSRSLLFRRVTKVGYFGLNKIDQFLEEYFPDKNGFFVELGANDGVSQSNTLFLEKYKNYQGVLIEPFPNNFNRCRKNRSKQNFYYMGACVSFEYSLSSIDLVYSNLMTVSLGGESTIENPIDHAKSGQQFLGEELLHYFSAEASTLTDVLIKSNAPKIIDFLSLDVEGAEIEVLNGIDFLEFRFRIICIETNSFDRVKNFFQLRGYAFEKKISSHDYVFKLNSIN